MIIACGQEHVMPDECPNCGFWLHNQTRGGFPGPLGRYCSEDCAADAQRHAEDVELRVHLTARDLMCDCPVCTAAGHPTAGERAEWSAYQAQQAVPR